MEEKYKNIEVIRNKRVDMKIKRELNPREKELLQNLSIESSNLSKSIVDEVRESYNQIKFKRRRWKDT